ncbi:hypothetical protein TanjilG_22993 [Lupinus angustifolius]|uniref:C2 domain-containing protein n=2 Tax=Lupinus angustifolius TaxID=3871 RepID=A0A1J7HXR6_LUPAN|nr:hypothetical protein TanjilG_22993 [Lupinus angustifolius]
MAGIQGQSLEVTVIGCSNLKDNNWISRQDPYICLEYASTKFRSKTCEDGGTNPVFQEKFVFSLIEGLRELTVLVWTANTLSHDDLIGSGKIQLHKVISEGFDDSGWPLHTSSGRSAGEVKLIMHYANANQRKSESIGVPLASPLYATSYPPPPSAAAHSYPSPPPAAAHSYPSPPPAAAHSYPSPPPAAAHSYPSPPPAAAHTYPSPYPTSRSYPDPTPSPYPQSHSYTSSPYPTTHTHTHTHSHSPSYPATSYSHSAPYPTSHSHSAPYPPPSSSYAAASSPYPRPPYPPGT